MGLTLVLTTLLLAAEPAVESPVAPPLSPVAPRDSLALFTLSPSLNLRIDLVAAEPQTVDPVAVAFDEAGRMFVVEMRDYPNGPADGQPPLSSLKLLEDPDGDGYFETSTVYADGLLFPTGVLPWQGGVIVTLAGEVRYFRDIDGDSVADINELWFRGFKEGNPQLRANHPILGPDGLVYIACGLSGGDVETVNRDWVHADQQPINVRGGDFRFDPATGAAEAISGAAQFGHSFDAFGNRFICSNRNPCDHVVFDRADLERNPHVSIGKPVQVVAAAGDDSRVFPRVDAWTTSTLHAGQFTAACGVTIFTGDALPAACVGNAFTCEPTGSLVHREVLTPAGATFTATPSEPGAEFLASRDPWFRPVDLSIGPDGALYVVDMYRAVIEHPEWMPDELKTRRDLRWGDDRGRIYRVAAADNPPGRLPTLAETNPNDLVQELDSPNGWRRETAARLLTEQPDRAADEALLHLLKHGRSPAGRLRAGQLLAARSDRDAALRLTGDEDARVVAAGVRLLTETVPAATAEQAAGRLLELADSDDARIRFEVTRGLGRFAARLPADHVTNALAAIVLRDANDRWTRAAVLMSAGRPAELFGNLAARRPVQGRELLVELAAVIGRRKDIREYDQVLANWPGVDYGDEWWFTVLRRLAEPHGGRLRKAVPNDPPLLKFRMRTRIDVLLQEVTRNAGELLADPGTPLPTRVEATRVLGLVAPEGAVPRLLELATAAPQVSVRQAAIETLTRFSDERIGPALLGVFENGTPAIRSAALDALLADSARARMVLEAVADGDLAAAELGAVRIEALRRHPDAELRTQAQKLFAPAADRQAVLAEYQTALSLPGDPLRGRAVFEKNCAACHRMAGMGTQVGPDIADSRTRTPAALLTDILDPNRAIDGNHLAYTVLTTSGRVEMGLLAGETTAAVTLRQAGGKTLTLDRDDIELLRPANVSLMPLGLERTVTPQQMADLIGFIKNWRYLDGAVPLAGERE